MYRENTELATTNQKFILPDVVDGDFTQEDMADDMDGLSMFFNRVKIPAGGGLQFELPTDDPDAPEYLPALTGVMLYTHAACAYWPETEDGEDPEDNQPLCSSLDGKTGIGTPGGACEVCALNAFGSGAKGRGKACKNMRVIYLLRSGEFLPIQFQLPPTSLRSFRDFMNRAFRLRNRASWGSVVEIKLKRETSGKDAYSVATFRRVYDFEGPELAQIRSYAGNFKTQILALNQQRTQSNAVQFQDFCEVPDATALPLGNGDDAFVIDGDRAALPR